MPVKFNGVIVIAILVAGLLIGAAVIFGSTLREHLFQIESNEADDWKQSVAKQIIDPESTTFKNTRRHGAYQLLAGTNCVTLCRIGSSGLSTKNCRFR